MVNIYTINRAKASEAKRETRVIDAEEEEGLPRGAEESNLPASNDHHADHPENEAWWKNLCDYGCKELLSRVSDFAKQGNSAFPQHLPIPYRIVFLSPFLFLSFISHIRRY